MEAVFLKLVNMSITASWLVLAVIAVRLVFRKTPKWILCLLWSLVAFRLICPFSIESALSLIPSAEPLPQEIIYTAAPEIQSGVAIIDEAVNPILESSLTPASPAVSANPTQIWSFILSQIWILGMVLMLLYTLISYLLLKRQVATAVPLEKGIKQSEFVDSPFVLGLIRPVIYLPFDMAEEDMTYVIAHEKAHIRRRDHWWKPVGFLLLSIYWFNPVLWLAYILLCRDIEAACDEKVVRDMGTDDRRAYSTALLNCSIHHRRIAACPLAFGEIGVKARVKGVMNYKKPTFWVILITLVISIVVAVCFLTNPESILPIKMSAMYVNRTGADLKFYYDDSLSEGEYKISEAYSLESLVDGNWQELTKLTDGETSEQVHEVASTDADFDAWSVLKWEENYGRLPDGTYRIRKEITITNDYGESETDPIYIEFTIGGTAEEYVTYTLEDITPTGANLYEHETVEDEFQLVYDGSEGFWMEIWQDGQWKYLEPTEYMESTHNEEKHYIRGLHYPSSHIELDWSILYGTLPSGTYRIAREITNTSSSNLRLCTAYAEFTIDTVYTWFDMYSTEPDAFSNYSDHIELIGTDGVMLQVGINNDIQLSEYPGDRYGTVIAGGQMVRNVFLTDLTGDGIYEICATTSTDSVMLIQVYDYAAKKLYKIDGESHFILRKIADRLAVLELDSYALHTVAYGQLALGEKGLKIRDIDQELLPLTKTVTCVDVATRKVTCLSSQEQMDDVLSLLRDLEGQVQPAPQAELKKAQEDYFNNCDIIITYALGEKALYFSEDFSMVWEFGSEDGYLIPDPEPLRSFVESVTDGVRGQKTSGEPFSTVDTPWDWCANIHSGAVESAQAYVCLYVRGARSSGTNGTISNTTLQELITILNQIPQEAFNADRMTNKETYHSIYYNSQASNSSLSIVDSVNGMAVVIRCCNGKLKMLLTDELDKVKEDIHTYLEPTQIWEIEDQSLLEFMQEVYDHPPVITYTVGAEYDWQDPVLFTSGSFSLELRLPEGWEYEQVTDADHSGIRCRPDGITEGWIYFSFWPAGYAPKEQDRYYQEGASWGYTTVTSYPSHVSSRTGVDVRNAVWSYQRTETEKGDFAVINEGADGWFLEFKDQIEDTISISDFTAE